MILILKNINTDLQNVCQGLNRFLLAPIIATNYSLKDGAFFLWDLVQTMH